MDAMTAMSDSLIFPSPVSFAVYPLPLLQQVHRLRGVPRARLLLLPLLTALGVVAVTARLRLW